MKGIQVYLHRQQVGAVIHALKAHGSWETAQRGGYRNLAVFPVQGSLRPADGQDQHYSMVLSEAVTDEYKIELVCEDEDVLALVEIIRNAAAIGRARSGWIFVFTIDQSFAIA